MIKAPDRKTNPLPEPVCYEESAESALGIAFEKRDGNRRFVPYAFLSALDYNGKDQLTFHFSIGAIVARGACLEPLWQAACKAELVRVWECGRPASSETTWVRELDFADSALESEHGLRPFPS